MATVEETMHPAVRLLLKRMATDPDEFIPPDGRWEKALHATKLYCTPEEKEALIEKFKAIAMDAIHVQIMKTLTHADDDDGSNSAMDPGAIPQIRPLTSQSLEHLLRSPEERMKMVEEAAYQRAEQQKQEQLQKLMQAQQLHAAKHAQVPGMGLGGAIGSGYGGAQQSQLARDAQNMYGQALGEQSSIQSPLERLRNKFGL